MTIQNRNRRLKPLVTLGTFTALTALAALSPVHAAEPAQPDRQLKTFIHDTYGDWRADRKGWQAEEGDFIHSPCGVLRVATADGPRMLLAMWCDLSSKIRRRSSCVRSHQACDLRIGISAAQVASHRPRPACTLSSCCFSPRSV